MRKVPIVMFAAVFAGGALAALPPLVGDGAHDDTAAIQARLDSGASLVYLPPPEKEYLISTTLVIRSGTELRLDRFTRVRLAPHAEGERRMLENANPATGDHDISVVGGVWDYDNVHQPPNPAYMHLLGKPRPPRPKNHSPANQFLFDNVTRLTFRGITIRNPVLYSTYFRRVSYFTIEDITFEQDRWNPIPLNMDGIDMSGGCHHGRIANLRGTCFDDMVALNADDPVGTPYCQPITDIDIDGLYSDYTHRGVRLYNNGQPVKRITIRNVHIRTYRNAVALTQYRPKEPRAVFDDIVIRDVMSSAADEPGALPHDKVAWPLVWVEKKCDVGHLVIDNVCRTETCRAAFPTIGIDPDATVENLTIRNCRQVNETKGDMVFLTVHGKVGKLDLGEVSLKSAPGAGRNVLRDDTAACGRFGLKPGWERLVSIGFDDFRGSDFSLVEPIFSAHGATATYNRPAHAAEFPPADLARIRKLEAGGNEIGDHTWRHLNFPFDDPLMNGQDPAAPEGGQTPFPSNAQLRDDRGDGCNSFGFPLKDSVAVRLSDFFGYDGRWSAFKATWGGLTDAQCQTIRGYFAVYGNPAGMLDLFDALSNRYLGTKGRSRGSWDAAKGCYTGGIFTDCRTSANHEIWERILALTRAAYRAQVRDDFAFETWSWPGSIPSPFLFTRNGRRFYDPACTVPANALARFASTRLKGADGTPLRRSWTEVLRAAGYVTTHDMSYPSRRDRLPATMMRRQLFWNASLSRRDALAYSTDRTVSYAKIAHEFAAGAKPAEMYDAGGSYRDFVEATRHDTARGVVHGEVIDSENTPSEAAFLTAALDYCQSAGIRVVSKREAYRRVFGDVWTRGNLLLNPRYRNTAAEFLKGAKTVPGNPDGYTGACFAETDDEGVRTLVTTGTAETVVYGVPLGKLRYSAKVSGRGRIRLRAVRNRTAADLSDCETLAELPVEGGDFRDYAVQLTVPDAPETEYEGRWEGLGDKVMALQVEYSSGLKVRGEKLEKDN